MEHSNQPARRRQELDQLAASCVAKTCKRYRPLATKLKGLLVQARNVHRRDGFCVLPARQ